MFFSAGFVVFLLGVLDFVSAVSYLWISLIFQGLFLFFHIYDGGFFLHLSQEGHMSFILYFVSVVYPID